MELPLRRPFHASVAPPIVPGGALAQRATSADGRREEWWDVAACRGKPVDTFFAGDEVSLARALVYCRACPVRGRCLEYALRNGIAYGVWGGATETERRVLRARR